MAALKCIKLKLKSAQARRQAQHPLPSPAAPLPSTALRTAVSSDCPPLLRDMCTFHSAPCAVDTGDWQRLIMRQEFKESGMKGHSLGIELVLVGGI